MTNVRRIILLVLILITCVTAWAEQPRLRISVDKSSYSGSEPIRLSLVFELGDGCWTLDPNATELSLKLHVFNSRGAEVPSTTQNIMYDLPRCNLVTLCRIDTVATHIFLSGKGTDMYASYYVLKPGRYRVELVYDSGFVTFAMRGDEDEYCRALASRRDIIKHLRSNVVKFEVLPNKPVQRKKLIRGVPGDNRGTKIGVTKDKDGSNGHKDERE